MDASALLTVPTLDPSRILRMVAGLRPYRRGGIRLAIEPTDGKVLVHNYGHGGSGITLSWGSAEEAADLVAQLAPTAKVLLERGYRVRVLARDFPPKTTSNIAAAEWFPMSVDVGVGEEDRARFRRMLRRSWDRFEALAADPGYGVTPRPSYEVDGGAAWPAGLPLDALPVRRAVERLPFPGPPRRGHVTTTFLIETPVYLPALLREVLVAGGRLEARTFRGREELKALDEPILVDCLGLGARDLFSDPALVPVRGQLVHLQPEPLPWLLTHADGYVFPRRDAIVLGGTFEEGVDDPTPDPAIGLEILRRHRRFFGLDP